MYRKQKKRTDPSAPDYCNITFRYMQEQKSARRRYYRAKKAHPSGIIAVPPKTTENKMTIICTMICIMICIMI